MKRKNLYILNISEINKEIAYAQTFLFIAIVSFYAKIIFLVFYVKNRCSCTFDTENGQI